MLHYLGCIIVIVYVLYMALKYVVVNFGMFVKMLIKQHTTNFKFEILIWIGIYFFWTGWWNISYWCKRGKYHLPTHGCWYRLHLWVGWNQCTIKEWMPKLSKPVEEHDTRTYRCSTTRSDKVVTTYTYTCIWMHYDIWQVKYRDLQMWPQKNKCGLHDLE